MKQLIILSLLGLVTIISCRKEDNPKIPDLYRVPTPLITIDAASDKSISLVNPASFKGRVKVDLFYQLDEKPQKFDIVVMKNSNKSTVKTLKPDVTTFPTIIEFTGQDLISLFGAPIANGDIFVIGANITNGRGQLFHAFPLGGNGYNSNIGSQPGASTSVQFKAM